MLAVMDGDDQEPAGDQQSKSGVMEGGGYYTAHSAPQEAYGELGFRWLEEAAREVPAPEGNIPLLIADLGTAGGGNSLEPMRRAIAAYRARDPARQVQVVHTDIPSNDFSAMFKLVEGSDRSYLRLPGTYAYATGRSFYERLFPDGVLFLGWSSIAVHWLSRVPEPIPDQIYCTLATGPAREALAARAKADWEAFLDDRAAELRPGGRLIVIGGVRRDDGASGADGLMVMAYDALKALVAAGTLTADELRRMTIPTWDRTESEFAAPLVSGPIASKLELRRHARGALPDAFFAAYQKTGDVDAYRDAVVGFFRAAFEPSLWSSLDPDREASNVAAIADAFRGSLGKRIVADPAAASCTWHVMILDIARR
jgi:hypothetical protein